MHTIFLLPWPAMLAVAVAFGLTTFALASVALRLFHRSLRAKPTALPVAPFFTAVTTVWALSFGFTAADIWSANARASQAATAERSAITRLAGTAHRDALDLPIVVDGLRAYRRAVEDHEWGVSANGAAAGEADLALQHIRLGIVQAAKAGAVDALVAKMVQDFDELQDARNERLALGNGAHNVYKWYLVLFLTFLSQIAIAFVHSDRARAGGHALAIYTVAATISIWILALHANPYVGVSSLTPDAIRVSF